jgi:nicotinamide riboside kinase
LNGLIKNAQTPGVWLVSACVRVNSHAAHPQSFIFFAVSQPVAIASVQQPIKTVCVIGPECTGKTDLALYLSATFGAPWVPEFARSYLDRLNRAYTLHDLTEIARGQVHAEDEQMQNASPLLVCDTNLLVIKIWAEFKYGVCPPGIMELHRRRTYHLYLLTYIDIPWQPDPQREHPHRREELWAIYRRTLLQTGVPVQEIRGSRIAREAAARAAVQKLLAP